MWIFGDMGITFDSKSKTVYLAISKNFQDQYLQNWSSIVDFFQIVQRNHRLPIEVGRLHGIPINERICQFLSEGYGWQVTSFIMFKHMSIFKLNDPIILNHIIEDNQVCWISNIWYTTLHQIPLILKTKLELCPRYKDAPASCFE